jgi:hypothetical protein
VTTNTLLTDTTWTLLPTNGRLMRSLDAEEMTTARLRYLAEVLRQQQALLLEQLHRPDPAGLAERELAFLRRVGPILDLPEVVRVALALRIPAVRDQIWLDVDEGAPVDWVLHITPQLSGVHRAAPFFLYAWGKWRAGDPDLARRVLWYALEADPGYSAARLLEQALRDDVRPPEFGALRGTILAGEGVDDSIRRLHPLIAEELAADPYDDREASLSRLLTAVCQLLDDSCGTVPAGVEYRSSGELDEDLGRWAERTEDRLEHAMDLGRYGDEFVGIEELTVDDLELAARVLYGLVLKGGRR